MPKKTTSSPNPIKKNWDKLGKKGKRGVGILSIITAIYAAHEPIVWVAEGSWAIGKNVQKAYLHLGEIPAIRAAYARDTVRIQDALKGIELRIDTISAKAIEIEMVEKYCMSITEVLKGELDPQMFSGIYLLVDNYGNTWYYKGGWLFRAEFNWDNAHYEYVDFTDGDKVKRCR